MSVKLNRPLKPVESQKDSNFNGKTIPYPEFEPGTSGLAVGSNNHCTIWVGMRGEFYISNDILLFSVQTKLASLEIYVQKTKQVQASQ
jgi:hypothetical protein